MCFFFSSRRRHTRWPRDWSSDVCSSDLSIVEGRALVQQEAMACGLPLIVTANAGGADLIDEGKTGFLVPIRTPERLAEKIDWLADHKPEAREMGNRAREKAIGITWDRYRARILDVILPISRGA